MSGDPVHLPPTGEAAYRQAVARREQRHAEHAGIVTRIAEAAETTSPQADPVELELQELRALVALRTAEVHERDLCIGLREAALAGAAAGSRPTERWAPVYLGRDKLLVTCEWGGRLVVPTFNVDVTIGPAAFGIHEAATTRVVQLVLGPSGRYLNAGANFGYYVALAAQCVGGDGRVIAVEPNPHILPYLLGTIHWSCVTAIVEAYNVALWHEDDIEVPFFFDPQYLGGGAADGLKDYDGKYSIPSTLDEALWSSDNVGSLFGKDGSFRTGRRMFLHFTCKTRSIDSLCHDLPALDVIHLDIEGAEPFALNGARRVIERSRDLRIITEWTAFHYTYGTAAVRRAVESLWDFLAQQGFVARHIDPHMRDGMVTLSEPLSFEWLSTEAVHGDYLWVREGQAPFVR